MTVASSPWRAPLSRDFAEGLEPRLFPPMVEEGVSPTDPKRQRGMLLQPSLAIGVGLIAALARHNRALHVLLLGLVLWAADKPCATAAGPRGTYFPHGPNVLEIDIRSEYSHIRVRKYGNVRELLFVRDNGDEYLESMLNLKRPYEQLVEYSRYMFASYLFKPKQEQVLIIGMGGGSMVHFYQHYDPEVRVEAVEIDPVVVKLADRLFGTRPAKNVRIVTADGLQYLAKTESRYEVIYLDAFLQPSKDTDPTGVPRSLKTAQFYRDAQEKLRPKGIMAFNLNTHGALEEDLRTLRSVFPQVYVFRLKGGNVVAVCARSETREELSVLQDRGKELDRRFKTGFSFPAMLRELDK